MTETSTVTPPPTPPPPASAGEPAPVTAPNRWVGMVALPTILFLLWLKGGWPGVFIGLSIVVIVVLHEAGHYIAARRGGMKVTEFFVGFGPRLWSFRRGETEYGIKAFWLGGYVKIPGMNMLEEVDPADEARTYRQASWPRRFAVAVAGSTVHFVLALVLLYVVLVGQGVDRDMGSWTVGAVRADTAAAAAGLSVGDDIVRVDGVPVPTWEDLSAAMAERAAGDEILLEVIKDGAVVEVPVTLGRNPETGGGFLGVGPDFPYVSYGPVEAVPETVQFFGEGVKETILAVPKVFGPESLGNLFSEATDDDTPTAGAPAEPTTDRPVSVIGIVDAGSSFFDAGFYAVLAFLVSINVFFGVFNLMPLLPFDGGHVVIGVYERIREALRGGRQRYHADVTKLLPVAYAVMGLLLFVSVMAAYLDITEGVNI